MRLYCTICFITYLFSPFASLSPLGKFWFLVILLDLQGCFTQLLSHWPHDPAEAGPGALGRPGEDAQTGHSHSHWLLRNEGLSISTGRIFRVYEGLLWPVGQLRTWLEACLRASVGVEEVCLALWGSTGNVGGKR